MNISYKIMSKLWSHVVTFVQTRSENTDESLNTISKDEFTKWEEFLFEIRNRTLLKVSHHFEETKHFHYAIRNIQELIRDTKVRLEINSFFYVCVSIFLLLLYFPIYFVRKFQMILWWVKNMKRFWDICYYYSLRYALIFVASYGRELTAFLL